MAIRRNDSVSQRYNRIAQSSSRIGSNNRSQIDDDYDRIANANRKLAAENVETTQQLSYKDYLDRKYQGITPKTSPAEQVGIADAISPDLASDSMASYAEYKNTKGAQLASYDLIADEVKDKLTELNNLRDTDNTGLIRKTDDGSGIFGYTLSPGYKENDIKKELNDVYNLSSSDVDTLAEVNKMAKQRDESNAVVGQGSYEKNLAEDAKKNYKRTYTEELAYAQEQFANKGGDNAQDLRSAVTEYNNLYKTAQLDQAGAALEMSTNVDSGNASEENFRKAGAMKASIMSKYKLSEEDWEDLKYYGQELDDYDEDAKVKQEAYENVHQDSVAKNVYGGFQNTLNSIGTYVAAPIGGIGEMAKYYGVGYRDSASPLNPNSPIMSYSNASGETQSATSEALNDVSPLASMVYDAGVTSIKSRMTNVFMPKGDGIFSVLKNPDLTVSAKMAKTLSKAGRDAIGLLPLFGASVFTQELSDSLKAGKTMQESIEDATAGTINEVEWEIGPADTFADTAVDTAGFGRTAKSYVGKVVTNLLKNGLGEATEELGGSITDRIYDDLKYGDKSEYNQSVQDYMDAGDSEEEAKAKATSDFVNDTIRSGVVGFMSGIMGGAMATGISVSNAVEGSKMFDNYTAQDYADFANALDVGDVNNVADRRFATKETTDADGISWDAMNDLNDVSAYANEDINALYNADELGDDGSGSHEYASEEARQSAKNAKEIALRLSKQDSVSAMDKLNLYYAWQDAVQTEEEAQRDKAEAEKFNQEREEARAEKAHQEFENHEKQTEKYYGQSEQTNTEVPEELKGETNNYTANDIYKRMANATSREELAQAVQDGRNSSNENTRVQTERNLEALTSMLESKTNITESDIAAIKQSDAEILDKAYRGEEVAVANNHQAQLVNYASQERIKAKAAIETENKNTVENNSKTFSNSAMSDIYKNGYQTDMNPNSYDRILKTVDAGGRNNIPLAEVRESLSADLSVVGGDSEALNNTIDSAYETAQKIAKNDALNAIRAAVDKQKTVKFTSGIVTDDRTDKTNAIDDSILNVIAGYYGMDISIVDDDSAPDILNGQQGMFAPSESKIYLNASQAEQFAGTAAHESVEVANFWAPAELQNVSQAFQRTLLNTLGTDEYNKFRNTWYKNAYAMESGKTEIDLDKEMLADAAPYILTNKDGMQAFIDEYSKDATPEEAKTFTEKLSKWIGNLKETVKNFFKDFVPTDYQKRVRDNIDSFDEVQTMLQDAMATARKNYTDAKLASLAETLDVSTDTDVEPEVVESKEDAYQVAYNAFANAVDAVYASEKDENGTRSEEMETAYVDAVRALRRIVQDEKADKLDQLDDLIRECNSDLFYDIRNFTQFDRVGKNTIGYKPTYDGVGTDNIPHKEGVELGEYHKRHSGKEVDGFMAASKLCSAISKYENKYGIADATVKRYLDDAKRAVNGIDEALEMGYSGVDYKEQIITEEGKLFKAAMKNLDEYSHNIGIKGYLYESTYVSGGKRKGPLHKETKSINLKSLAASIRNIETYQAFRDVIGEEAEVKVDENGNMIVEDNDLPFFSRPVGPVANTNGADLKEGQKEFFKDSKAVDDDGKLKIMYHGTRDMGFTVYDSAKTRDGAFYFTDDSDVAKTYTQSHSDSDVYGVYLNVKNPLVVDFNGEAYDGGVMTDNALKAAAERANKKLAKDSYSLTDALDEWDTDDTDDLRTILDDHGVSKKDINTIVEVADRMMPEDIDGMEYYREGLEYALESGEYSMDTHKWVEYAREKGHDGVIFNNIYAPSDMVGEYAAGDKVSNVIAVFDSNQAKTIENDNPTADADIRFSVEVGDSNNMNNEDITRDRAKESSIIDKVYKAIKDSESTVNRDTTDKIAQDIHSEFSSAYDLKTFQDNMYALFTYWHDGQHNVNMNDFMAVLQDVVRPVVDSAYATQTAREDFAQFAEVIGKHEIALTSEDRAAIKEAFGSLYNFEKHYPEIKINADGQPLSEMWETLVEESGGLLPFDADTSEMAGALADTLDALRPSYNMFADNTETAYDTTLDIVTKYLSMYHDDGATKGVINEMVDRATKELKASQKEWKQQAKAKYDERLAKEREKLKDMTQKYSRSKEQIAKLRAKNATRVKDIYEQRRVRDQLRSIQKTYKSLYDYAVRPSDNKHIPYSIQEPVYRLLSAIDMSGAVVEQGKDGKWHTKIMSGREYAEDGKHYKFTFEEITADTREEAIQKYREALDRGLGTGKNQAWYDRMKQIDDLYQKVANDGEFNDQNSYEVNEFLQGLDQDLRVEFHKILEKAATDKIPLTSLNSKDLATVSKMLKNVLKSVNGINKSLTIPSIEISTLAQGTINHANTVNGRKHAKAATAVGRLFQNFADAAGDFLMLDNATMETYLHAIGCDGMTDILLTAQNNKAKCLRESQEFSKNLLANVDSKLVKSWEKDVIDYGKIKLTKAQVMSLYETMKREDATSHRAGGFEAAKGDKPAYLTDADLEKIVGTLTTEEKQIADAIQQFLAVNCSDWGNRTSLVLSGFKKFTDPRYFPMTVDKETVNANIGEFMGGLTNGIKNMGMTKAVQEGANNPLIINGIFDVYAQHVSDMATYSAWAAPIQDMIRFYNYKESVDVDGGFKARVTTKSAINQIMGENGSKYFTRMVSDIQGREQSSFVGGGFVEYFTGAAKKAAVMGNLRVVWQQPTAIFRAGKMINYKYLNAGMAFKNENLRKQMIDSSDVYWIKNQGNIDGYITTSLKSQITGIQDWQDTISDKAGWFASKADQLTWDAMYRAVITEQIDKMGKSKVGTQEFQDAVNKRFDDIMLRTQVYDATIARSQFMRSTDWLNKMQSAFMAEPVKTYNLVLRDMIDIMQSDTKTKRNAAKKALGRSLICLLITNVVNSGVVSWWDAFRGAGDADDEDKGFLERMLEAFGIDRDAASSEEKLSAFLSGNLVDNVNMLNNIPIISDYWDEVSGTFGEIFLNESSYGTSSNDLSMSGIEHLGDALKALLKPGEKQTTYGAFTKVARAFSDATGIPVYAIQRDAVAIYNVIAHDVAPALGNEDMPVLQKSTKNTKTRQAKIDTYGAIVDGSSLDDVKSSIESAVDGGNTYESINSGMKKALQEELQATYDKNPSEATKMINRIAEIKAYLAEKNGTYKDKTHSEKVEKYKKDIKEWIE